MFRSTLFCHVRDPVPTDTKSFYTWFSGQTYRQEQAIPGGYPAIRVYPVYGKRWFTGRTFLVLAAAVSCYGAWMMPEKLRYTQEERRETEERQDAYIPYQKAEINLRMFISAYRRHRYEQENLINKGYVGLNSEFRKFFYHSDVWRPPFIDLMSHPYSRTGSFFNSYNWALGNF